MDARYMFAEALRYATQQITKVTALDLDKPTPDTDWQVRELTNHMVKELSYVPDMAQSKTRLEIGLKYHRDFTNDDLQTLWHRTSIVAQTAVARSSPLVIVTHARHAETLETYVRSMACELLIHTWDLGAALGHPPVFDADIIAATYVATLPNLPHMRETHLYSEPLHITPETEPLAALLALYGRDARWHSPVTSTA